MAKHRVAKKRRARKALLAGAATAGLSSVLVLGQTTDTTAPRDIALAATVIGVGGRDDPTSTRLRDKLGGDYALGFDDTNYVPIQYPANLAFQSSIDVGIPRLAQAVVDADGNTRIVSYSEGTLVAEQVKRNLANPKPDDPTPPSPDDLDFEFMASPYLPNGGIFARFPGFAIPGLLPTFSAAQPTAYDSTYVTNEYDGFADFPAYFNPVSLANALLGMAYAHPDQYYDGIAFDDLIEGRTKFTKVLPNGANGTDTYILVYNPHLPLLAPVRQVASLLMLTPLTEPVLSAIEPLVRVAVDMGYTDRTNANPATATTFSFITPPAKFVEAAAAIPGAVTPHSQEESSAGNQRQSTVPKAPDELLRPAAKPTSPAEPLKTVAQDVRARITHPTLTSDGNLTRPGVTAGATPNESGGPTTDSAVAPAEVGPVTTDSSAGEPTSNDETGSDGAAAA